MLVVAKMRMEMKSFHKMRNVRGSRERLTAYLSVLPRTSFGVFFPEAAVGDNKDDRTATQVNRFILVPIP